jgi:Lrp/AsnC family transcriptional regulator, leucine-responsive regulatory protein
MRRERRPVAGPLRYQRLLVEAAVPDLASYEQLLLGQILTIPSVVEAQSTFAIRTILSRGPQPLDHWQRARREERP